MIDRLFPQIAYPFLREVLRDQRWHESRVLEAASEHLVSILSLRPHSIWLETVKVSRMRSLPDRQLLLESDRWRSTLGAFKNGTEDDHAVCSAASQLFLESAMYMVGFHEPAVRWLCEIGYLDDMIAAHLSFAAETQSLFAELADKARDRSEPTPRVAHFLRDLAYGDDSRVDDLKAMVESDDPEHRQILVDCYWLATKEERVKEENEDRQSESIRSRPKKAPRVQD